MSVGVVCCRVLEREVRAVIRGVPEVTRLEVMDWGLHIQPDRLLEEVSRRIRSIESRVDAVMLGYGRCQALDRLPSDFAVPVLRPAGEDCIGVLLGQHRYERELMQKAGTWFLTPGWTELGMEFIFQQLQLENLAEKGLDPMAVAHRMLKEFTRSLYIDMQLENGSELWEKARAISSEFNMVLERTAGSLERLTDTLYRAIDMSSRGRV
ncbi:MAG: DUF1638 domain-containing protein [Desulfobacterales bacterium]